MNDADHRQALIGINPQVTVIGENPPLGLAPRSYR
jgi:hypothetical protein